MRSFCRPIAIPSRTLVVMDLLRLCPKVVRLLMPRILLLMTLMVLSVMFNQDLQWPTPITLCYKRSGTIRKMIHGRRTTRPCSVIILKSIIRFNSNLLSKPTFWTPWDPWKTDSAYSPWVRTMSSWTMPGRSAASPNHPWRQWSMKRSGLPSSPSTCWLNRKMPLSWWYRSQILPRSLLETCWLGSLRDGIMRSLLSWLLSLTALKLKLKTSKEMPCHFLLVGEMTHQMVLMAEETMHMVKQQHSLKAMCISLLLLVRLPQLTVNQCRINWHTPSVFQQQTQPTLILQTPESLHPLICT